MSEASYKFYEKKFNDTKPIRGRSVEVRPIGKRRRDWEQVTRKDLGDGTFAYCARLYQTEVVEYHPDGSIVLRTGGWPTPSTAEFIHEHSPFSCFKRNKRLWVRDTGDAAGTLYPLNAEGMKFKWLGDHHYSPAEPVVIKKRVVNRSKAKTAREPVMPFLNWAKAFLTMSDGWVMHETRKQVLGWDDEKFVLANLRIDDEKINLKKLIEASESDEPEAFYLDLLCRQVIKWHDERRTAESREVAYDWAGQMLKSMRHQFDYRVKFDTIKRHVYKWVEEHGDVHDVIEVGPSIKTMTNVI